MDHSNYRVAAFLDARRRYQEATAEVERMVAAIAAAAAKLKNWKLLPAAKAQQPLRPDEVGALSKEGPPLGDVAWPDPKKFQVALEHWHDAEHQMNRAHRMLDPAEQASLPPLN